MRRFFLISGLLYFFVLLQTSFLLHVLPVGFIPNLVFGFVILLALFEAEEYNTKFAAAIVGGFLLDVYSAKPFGFWTLLLVTSVFLIQTLVANYVRTPTFKRI